jgi:hypothetical protein
LREHYWLKHWRDFSEPKPRFRHERLAHTTVAGFDTAHWICRKVIVAPPVNETLDEQIARKPASSNAKLSPTTVQ